MEELLNERYPTSKMPQMWGEFFRTAKPLPELWNTPCIPEQEDALTDTQHGEGNCGL